MQATSPLRTSRRQDAYGLLPCIAKYVRGKRARSRTDSVELALAGASPRKRPVFVLDVSKMTAGKADYLRRRLANAGLSADAISRYSETLKMFLTARLTKIRFEEEMSKVLPRDKIHVHNAIIREIFHRAQLKREGLPDLPVIAPPRERRPPTSRRERPSGPVAKSTPPNISNAPAVLKSEPAAPPVIVRPATVKRKREEHNENDQKPNGATEPLLFPQARPKVKPVVPKRVDKVEQETKPVRNKAKTPNTDKSSPKRLKRGLVDVIGVGESNGSLTTPANGAVSTPRAVTGKNIGLSVPPVEIATYDEMSFFPIRPGQAMDLDLFLKLRPRMRRICVDHMGVAGVKDDAVALMQHAVEIHVKNLLEAAVQQRIARECTRPLPYSACDVVTTHDVREAALSNPKLLADDDIELERLSMLL